jgi:hypothetical protein
MSTENEYTTAFLVLINKDGSPSVFFDLPETSLKMERKATNRDVRRACLEISADLAALASAEMTAQILTPPKEPTPAEAVAEALSRREETP